MVTNGLGMPNVISKLILAALVYLTGCSSTDPAISPAGVPASGAVAAERDVFSSVSAFYCDKYRWPATWQELVEFHTSHYQGKREPLLRGFEDPTLSSSRAILITLTYKNQTGGTRTATFIAPPSCSKSEVTRGDAAREVSIAGGGIKFRLPEGFRLMKGADIKAYWKAAPYPDAAWIAEDGRLVAIRFGDVELAADQVGEFLHDLSDAYEASVPSLQWRVREVQVIGDRTFLRHEFENSSSKGRLVNVVLSSSFAGRLFAITATGPAEQGVAILQAAGQLEDSLTVR